MTPPGDTLTSRYRDWAAASWWRPAVRSGAVLVPILTCAVLSTVRDEVTAATAVLLLVLVVVGAAATGDRVAALLAAVSGAVWFDFFLTEPYLRFAIDAADDVETVVLLAVISLAVSEIALWGRRQQAQASRRSGYLDGLLVVARAVAESSVAQDAVVEVVGRQIVAATGVDDARFVPGPVRDGRVALLDHDGRLIRGASVVDVERVGFPTDEYVALLVRRDARTIGHFLLSNPTHLAFPTREQRQVAVLLADQVAIALDETDRP